MHLAQRAAIQEIVDKVSREGPKAHLYSVLKALKFVEGGAQSFREPDPGGAIGLGERVLRELDSIPGVEKIGALVRQSLIAEYAKAEQYDAAIAVGTAALPWLASDSRLAYIHAGCLHNLGGVLVESGRVREGANHMEQAMSIYDLHPERSSEAEICRKNLEKVRAVLAQDSKKPSLWSRLFGKG